MKYANLDIKHKRRSHNIFKKIIFEKFPNQNPKILDVGCATGVIGRLLGSKNNIYGIENNPELFKIANKYCEQVFNLDLNNFNVNEVTETNFQMIFLGDVLEHLVNPRETLRKIIKLAKDDGCIIISLPNIAQLQFRIKLLFGIFNYTDTGVMDKSHLHFYTLKTAKELINSVNLKIIKTYPSGTIVSYLNIFPTLLAPQFIYVCQKQD
jgi:2-polyprenyl-3-methyl-5-hydroxy-6-metoxy-1,4-benzoquinol methylase